MGHEGCKEVEGLDGPKDRTLVRVLRKRKVEEGEWLKRREKGRNRESTSRRHL